MKLNWVTGIVLLIMLITLVIGITYYYNIQNQKCISSPLSYGANQMEQSYGYKFIGKGFFLVPMGKISPIIMFNSTSVEINRNQ